MNDYDALPPDRADKLARLQELKQNLDADKAEYDRLVQEVVVPMTESEFITGKDGLKYRVSRVASSTPVYHFGVLDEINEDVRREITKISIDGPKLKAAVQTDRLDPDIADRLVTYKPKTPYPKFDLIS